MSYDQVEIINKKTLYKRYFRVNLYKLRHKLFAGGWSENLNREVFERGKTAAVMLYDPSRESVVLLEQFRPGALAAELGNPWLIEIVAGIIENNETPEEVVRREAIEEAGCKITDIVPMMDVYVSPGASSEIVSLFCGRVDSEGVGGIHGKTSEGEDIRVIVEPIQLALDRLNKGEISNVILITALQWLALNMKKLRQNWLSSQTS